MNFDILFVIHLFQISMTSWLLLKPREDNLFLVAYTLASRKAHRLYISLDVHATNPLFDYPGRCTVATAFNLLLYFCSGFVPLLLLSAQRIHASTCGNATGVYHDGHGFVYKGHGSSPLAWTRAGNTVSWWSLMFPTVVEQLWFTNRSQGGSAE